jgi:hypothetical protein
MSVVTRFANPGGDPVIIIDSALLMFLLMEY